MKRTLVVTLIATSLLLGLVALTLGQSSISLKEVIGVLSGTSPSAAKEYIILRLRAPRILSAYLAGAILGFSGAIFQAALRNPMADPFILGVSSGASFGVAVALSLGLSAFSGFPIAALLGSVLTTLVIIGHSYSRRGSTTTLLLTGVALNYILSALMTLLLFMNQEQYQRILFWSLGSFSSATWVQVRMLALLAAVVMTPLVISHRSLDLLLLDDSSALAAGLAVRSMRLGVLLPASIATAICVSFFGIIGFIGLIAPHISRLVVGPKHSRLLPTASLFGGILLLGSDTLARLLLPSGELPVGVITSLLGVPLFLYLLRAGRYRYEYDYPRTGSRRLR